jgi:hypothetical protein
VAEAVLPLEGLRELRARRTRRRTAEVHWIDAFYQAYLTAVLGGLAILAASGWIGDEPVSASGAADVVRLGPATLGVLGALALAIGLRSGSRGGPLAIEEAELRLALLAPVPLGPALRSPALRQLRFLLFVAGVVGAIVGQLALRRLDGNPVAWISCVALWAVAVASLAVGIAWIAAGRRVPRPWATAVGSGLVGWAVADLAGVAPTSPTTLLGQVAVWPLDSAWWGILPLACAPVALVVGLRSLGGISLEQAQRRSALVGQLRFAATMRDLRTVLVLRRQLAQERPRSSPWLRWHRPGRSAVRMRGWRSLARTPGARLLRLAALGAVAALAARGAWDGSTPLVLVAGIAAYLAALDAVEPLAQEVDHPSVVALATVERGAVLLRHLLVPAVTMVGVGLVGVAAVAVTRPGSDGLAVALVAAAPAALAACAGAVISTVKGAPDQVPSGSSMLVPPEAAGMRMVFQAVWPPAVATIGFLPVLVARSAADQGASPAAAAAATTILPIIVVALTAGWVRVRDDLHAWFARAMEQAGQARRAPEGHT